MLQHFFKLVFRAAERKPVQAEGQHRGLRMDEARPKPEFVAQVLRSALAQKHTESRGGRVVHQSPYEPSSKPASRDAEQPDEKVMRLMPRRRPTTEQVPNPPTHDDDNDPGPSAA
ncbi:hypothetical protein AA309_30570 [Microvirga vignae]|uniref:Uncharacterized protein n=1 Tax=Microvirga vignae TaxID=1225564 RepID=A0A0H1R3F4_9HYPH|nr:hypothetical protein AA309_30570 [Microvirga vignae]